MDLDRKILEYLEKEAGLPPLMGQLGNKAVGLGKRLGQGAWNIAFGGKGSGAAWNPWHGVQEIGKVKAVYPKGHQLAGMRMLDPKTGEPVYEQGKNLFKFMRQELQGSMPRRSDVYAMQQAKKHTKLVRNAKGGMDEVKLNTGEFLDKMKNDPKFQEQLKNIEGMSPWQFMKNNPKAAARYYGGHTLQKGFMAGLPGYEAYNLLKNKEGQYPEEGMGANMGSTVGSGLGWLGSLPLGWVGAPLAVGGIAGAGRLLGRGVDKAVGNKPLGTQSPYPFPGPSQVQQLPMDYATGNYPPGWLDQYQR